MQTGFRTNFSWKRGFSMMLLTLFSFSVAVAQVLVRGTVVDQTGAVSYTHLDVYKRQIKETPFCKVVSADKKQTVLCFTCKDGASFEVELRR